VEAAGIEGTALSSEPIEQYDLTTNEPHLSALCLHGEDIASHNIAATDKMLRRIVELWAILPPSVQQAIYAKCVEAVLLGD
jgi:hypothetical protein